MKLLLTLLLCAAPAAAQQPAITASTAAPAAAAQETPAEIQEIIKYLSVLIERAPEIPGDRMKALRPEAVRFKASVKETLGKEIVAEIAAREKEAEVKARTEESLRVLRAFRAALQTYYSVNGGRYPGTLKELVPQYIQEIPPLTLPEHEPTSKVTVIDSRKYDKDSLKSIKDSGGWLYFSDPKSLNYGLLILDCSHESPDGTKFFEY